MIKVDLNGETNVSPEKLASYAAKGCYKDEKPAMGELLDIRKTLFETGHHTTLQHNYFTFFIENIAVSDVTLGLHLANPFYNSSQRSGRFSKMFARPDFEFFGNYIHFYWPHLSNYQFASAMRIIREGIEIYRANINDAIKIAEKFIKEERPRATEDYIKKNAPKFAQEQMRVFIPTIFPTALTFTVNLSALCAMYAAAKSPTMIDATAKMASLILKKYSNLDFLFRRIKTIDGNPFAEIQGWEVLRILLRPKAELVSAGDASKIILPELEHIHPIDCLHFTPDYMQNNEEELKVDVEISMMTFGQDQRHRTIKRGKPHITGGFYLPPIPYHLNLEHEAINFFHKWFFLAIELKIPKSLWYALMPYGAMIGYRKTAPYNALIHEQLKRLCWCAQEEIYHLNLALREQVEKKGGSDAPILKIFSPICMRTGKCGEGDRYCGRNIGKEPHFPERKI